MRTDNLPHLFADFSTKENVALPWEGTTYNGSTSFLEQWVRSAVSHHVTGSVVVEEGGKYYCHNGRTLPVRSVSAYKVSNIWVSRDVRVHLGEATPTILHMIGVPDNIAKAFVSGEHGAIETWVQGVGRVICSVGSTSNLPTSPVAFGSIGGLMAVSAVETIMYDSPPQNLMFVPRAASRLGSLWNLVRDRRARSTGFLRRWWDMCARILYITRSEFVWEIPVDRIVSNTTAQADVDFWKGTVYSTLEVTPPLLTHLRRLTEHYETVLQGWDSMWHIPPESVAELDRYGSVTGGARSFYRWKLPAFVQEEPLTPDTIHDNGGFL